MKKGSRHFFLAALVSFLPSIGCNGGGVAPESIPADTIPLDGRGGGVIAYSKQPGPSGGLHEIFAINADGTGDQRIIQASIGLNHHDWAPGGLRMAATGYVNQSTWSIYVFNVDGTGLTRLTSMDGVLDSDPAWSPDGSQIAFSRIYQTEGGRSELWLMNADGSDQRWIGVEGFVARWSPDGSRFVFQSTISDFTGIPSDIQTCAIDGTDVRTLTSTPSDERAPVWSPTGSEIAFSSNEDGDHEIVVMSSDGGNRRKLTDNTSADHTPRWSPNGSSIAFGSDRSEAGHWEVYVMAADGTGVRRVTNTPSPLTAINPVWRPTYGG